MQFRRTAAGASTRILLAAGQDYLSVVLLKSPFTPGLDNPINKTGIQS